MSSKMIALALILLFLPVGHTVYDWSFQQRLQVPEAGSTFGSTPSALFGRGFLTLVTGYDASSSSPGIFIHSTDEGTIQYGQYVWSQQAKLVPKEVISTDRFGQWMVASNTTLIVSAPAASAAKGYVYIFNGTQRHWSQIQRLQPYDGALPGGDLFGERMSLYGKRLVVAAKGQATNAGAVYVYERQTNGLYWSVQSKLVPRDAGSNQYFGQDLSLYDNTAVISAVNDDVGLSTGSAYIFRGTGASWSQQQQLVAIDMENYKKSFELQLLDVSLGQRYLGPSVTVTSTFDVAIGVRSADANKRNKQTVYVYSLSTASNKWSLQQKLFNPNESHPELHNYTEVYAHKDTLFATVHSANLSTSFIFGTAGTSWSEQTKLLSYDASDPDYYPNPGNASDESNVRPGLEKFSRPQIWGSTLIHQVGLGIDMRTPFRNDSCLQLWMSDHYKDGWDTAVLTVRAPDLTNDTFHPHCDQVEPFMVRYCPYSADDEGVYIIKVFAPTSARFYWEMSWQVYEEATGIWYKGDFATKMLFSFSKASMTFSLVASENLVALDDVCNRCVTIARSGWADSQKTGNSGFWPLVVSGSPYYISDYQGRTLYFAGKVCDGVTTYECYQTLTDGFYTLRLGNGLFGPLTGFPYADASWSGCGAEGGARDQFVFRITDGVCYAVQKYTYTGRCDRPPAISTTTSASTVAPTGGGTVAPTQSVYGDVYIKGQMYAMGDHADQKHSKGAFDLRKRVDGDKNKDKFADMPDHMFMVP